MKRNKNLIFFLVIVSLVFISIYVLNHFTVYTSDDYSFLYEYNTVNYEEGIERINSLNDIVISMKNLYKNVNGRVVFHFILQCILAFPKFIFNILNSLVFVFFGIFIYKTINKEKIFKNFKPWLLILIYSLMFLLFPSFGMTTLWCSGSLNYMWSVFVIILYFNYLINLLKKEKIKITDYILIFLLSLMSGNTVENFSLSALFFTIIEFIIYIVKNKKFKIWYLLPLIGLSIGIYLLLTAAPLSERKIVENLFSFNHIYERSKFLIEFLDNRIYLILSSFILLSITYFKNHKSDKHILIYYLTGIFSLAPLYASPYIEERMFFLLYVIIIISIVFFVFNALKKEIIKILIAIVFLAISLYVYIFVCFKDVKVSYDRFIKIENIILENKENNILDIEVPNYRYEYSKYTVFNNNYAFMGTDEDLWINKWIAHYYEVNLIKVNKDKKLE